MTLKYLGKLFKRCRKVQGLSQDQIAKLFHCSQGRISKIESGRTGPSAMDLWTLITLMTNIDLETEFETALRSTK